MPNTVLIELRLDRIPSEFINKFKCKTGEGMSCFLHIVPRDIEGDRGETHFVKVVKKTDENESLVVGRGREVKRATDMPTLPTLKAEVRIDQIGDEYVNRFETKAGTQGLSARLRVVPLLHPENNKYGHTHYICIEKEGDKIFCGNGREMVTNRGNFQYPPQNPIKDDEPF